MAPPSTGVKQGQYPITPSGTYQGPHPSQPAQQAVVIAPMRYGRDPITMQCPNCQHQIQTQINSKPGDLGDYLLY